MRSLQFIRTIAALSLVALGATACGGAGFDPADKIKGLRVIAVQKDNPYPRPNEEVNLKLLYWDGKATPGSPRDIKVNFFPCVNPPGDLYYRCYADLLSGGLPPAASLLDAGRETALAPEAAPIDATSEAQELDASDVPETTAEDASDLSDATNSLDGASAGDALLNESGIPSYEADHVRTYSIKIPDHDHIIRPLQQGTPYGLVYILFTVCAGHLGPATAAVNSGLPVACYDDDGHALGPDDFVPGYSSIYVYDDRHNNNPVIRDFLFDNASLQGSPGLADGQVRHIPHCTGGSCPTYDIKVALDQAANQEKDPGSTGLDGQELWEQMWLAFYATGGDFDHPLRLVNDASAGWNEDNGAKFTAPAEPGPVRIWGVVHDNRGGVAWLEGKIIVD